MSDSESNDFRQDRRQWLKTSASAIGAALLPVPTIVAEPSQNETAAPNADKKLPESKATTHFFNPAQYALVAELSETIIPADSHSGGAKAAKVADYVDQALRESFDPNQKALWREGLRLVDLMTRHYSDKSFVDATPEERIAVLTVLSNND